MVDDEQDNDEEASLGEQIVLPRNADCCCQALVDKITPLDIA
jgi:hypothetical protein